jgi:hypothetical protein
MWNDERVADSLKQRWVDKLKVDLDRLLCPPSSDKNVRETPYEIDIEAELNAAAADLLPTLRYWVRAPLAKPARSRTAPVQRREEGDGYDLDFEDDPAGPTPGSEHQETDCESNGGQDGQSNDERQPAGSMRQRRASVEGESE